MDDTLPPDLRQSIEIDTLGPVAALGDRRMSMAPGALVGAFLTLGLHVSLAGLLMGLHAIPTKSAAERLAEELQEKVPDTKVLTTRLVKLGKMRDRRQLPDRFAKQVRALAPDARVGTPEDIAIARSGKAPTKVQEKAPTKVSEEDLSKALERAKILAQVGDTRSTEGSPEGVRDGEIGPEEASPLDLYVTLLHRLIRQRWSTPASILPEELASLRCVVSVQFNRDLTIGAARVAQSSGNAAFDESAMDAVQRFRNEVRTIPPPPDETVAEAIFGRAVTIRFRGRDLR